MAKTILPYSTHNRLQKLIKQKAKAEGKSISQVEEELGKYCNLTISKNGCEAIKKYKYNSIEPSLPVALKMCKYFGTSLENVFELREG